MSRRYVAGQAIDKERLLNVLREFEVDELWVDFENPFNYVRGKHGFDYVYIIWYDGDKSRKYWSKASGVLESIFDPDITSDEEEIVENTNIMVSHEVNARSLLSYAEKINKKVTKIYDKEVGFLR